MDVIRAISNNPHRAWCRPCRIELKRIVRESFGDVYWCPGCGTSVEFSMDRPTIVVDRYEKAPSPEGK